MNNGLLHRFTNSKLHFHAGCRNPERCPGWLGHRKVMLRVSDHFAVNVHSVSYVCRTDACKVNHLSAYEYAIAHLRGAASYAKWLYASENRETELENAFNKARVSRNEMNKLYTESTTGNWVENVYIDGKLAVQNIVEPASHPAFIDEDTLLWVHLQNLEHS